jgi:DnaK suppressor protein
LPLGHYGHVAVFPTSHTEIEVIMSSSSSSRSGPSAEESLRSRLQKAQVDADRAKREYEEAIGDDDVIQEDRDSARQILEEATARLRSAERAVERIESGEYGRCESCGAEIAAERLDAIPDATTCRACSK